MIEREERGCEMVEKERETHTEKKERDIMKGCALWCYSEIVNGQHTNREEGVCDIGRELER